MLLLCCQTIAAGCRHTISMTSLKCLSNVDEECIYTSIHRNLGIPTYTDIQLCTHRWLHSRNMHNAYIHPKAICKYSKAQRGMNYKFEHVVYTLHAKAPRIIVPCRVKLKYNIVLHYPSLC